MNDHKAMAWAREMTHEGDRILAYWREHVVLPDGSFHGRIASDGQVDVTAPRSLVLATRILWTFSRAVNSGFADTVQHRLVADRAYDFLLAHYWDEMQLGFYWSIGPDNEPLDDWKHVYGQAFAVYALAEYYAVNRNPQVLQIAQLTYLQLESVAADPVHGGYREAFLRNWELATDVHHHVVNHGFAKSMNTHLHMLEAYTRLYQVWPHAQLCDRLERLLDVMMDHVVNQQTHHFNLFFERNWQVQGDVISFGHDIEGSWLMLEAAETLGDAGKIASCHTLAVQMVDAVLREGVSPEHGVMSEAQNGRIIDPDVHWWPQAEGIVGCVNAYQVSGNPLYLEAAQALWQFAQRYLVNSAQGEWFRLANQSGVHHKSPWIVDPWKCPYHNARSCMEVTTRLQAVR